MKNYYKNKEKNMELHRIIDEVCWMYANGELALNLQEMQMLKLDLNDEINRKWLKREPIPTDDVETKKDIVNYCIRLVSTKIEYRECGRAWATWILEGLQRSLEKMS